MNKELFVSSTPHETKVGLVEDDLLAEVYLERENEYTLAGSIYKGRVTRVLPGMQSAFVDIGLERDAFLYVSDFMELEEHDEDLTESVPAGRGVQDLRPQGESSEAESAEVEPSGEVSEASSFESSHTESEGEGQTEIRGSAAPASSSSGANQDRDRAWRGRRRRRGGRRDGRERGPERYSQPANEEVAAAPPARVPEPGRSRQFGPPAGYEPILLPGESISKYRGMTQAQPAQGSRPQVGEAQPVSASSEAAGPVSQTFPDDEPIFAASTSGEILHKQDHEQHEEHPSAQHEHGASGLEPSAATSQSWNQEFRNQETPDLAASGETVEARENFIERHDDIFSARQPETQATAESFESKPLFSSPGILEEETIEEEEAESVRYEGSSDDSYEEFEEESREVGRPSEVRREISEVRETVDEIHMSSLAEAGVEPAPEVAPDTEEDSEELELEEAQAEAEALLDAEVRGTGTVDARAEVRAASGTAGYTQRAPRPRPGYDRRGQRRGNRRFPRRQSQDIPKISDLLKEGQEILVQIAKEPIGKKGARITSHIALPGRFLVYMPTVNHTGVSRKIASDEERQRLKRIVMSERDNGQGGFIVRTAAQSATEEELRADIRFLKGLWNDIRTRSEASKPPALIYHDLNVVERVLRDQVTSDFSVIWVDTEPEYERILRFFNRFQPGLVKRVKLYTKETPLFEQFGLAEEMNKALKSKVWLKSGGYIVINQTEALVAIDINTGKYVGKTSRLEDTIVKTNVDAIKEIVRQVRLRDLGGIIIIDFIDMDERRNRQRVMQALEEELRHDRAPSKVLQFNDFGLVAITRKRVKQSLERTIGAPCPYCQSTGYVKSVTTICNEIYVEMRKIAKHLEHEDVMLRVNPDVAKELKANNGRLLNEMEELSKRTIIVKSDPALHQEQFDIN
jgi:Rne/Rng family ribonuclease